MNENFIVIIFNKKLFIFLITMIGIFFVINKNRRRILNIFVISITNN